MESTAQRNYSGYMGFMYRQFIKDGLQNGLPVQQAIEDAQEKMSCIPHVEIVEESQEGCE